MEVHAQTHDLKEEFGTVYSSVIATLMVLMSAMLVLISAPPKSTKSSMNPMRKGLFGLCYLLGCLHCNHLSHCMKAYSDVPSTPKHKLSKVWRKFGIATLQLTPPNAIEEFLLDASRCTETGNFSQKDESIDVCGFVLTPDAMSRVEKASSSVEYTEKYPTGNHQEIYKFHEQHPNGVKTSVLLSDSRSALNPDKEDKQAKQTKTKMNHAEIFGKSMIFKMSEQYKRFCASETPEEQQKDIFPFPLPQSKLRLKRSVEIFVSWFNYCEILYVDAPLVYTSKT